METDFEAVKAKATINDYPDEAELETLRYWEGTPAELYGFLTDHWWAAGSLIHLEKFGSWEEPWANVRMDERPPCRWWKIATGGWSGNEERIEALRGSGFVVNGFWTRFWYLSRVGGGYEFRFPVDQYNLPVDPIHLVPRAQI